MNVDKLQESLSAWVQVDTWHSFHPLDLQRFHKALKSAFDSQKGPIEFDDFKNAITQAVEKYHPALKSSHVEEIVEKYAQRADDIYSYLRDNRYY